MKKIQFLLGLVFFIAISMASCSHLEESQIKPQAKADPNIIEEVCSELINHLASKSD